MTDCQLIVLDTAYFIVAVSLKWLISIVVLQCGLIDLISMLCLIFFSTDNWNKLSILSQDKSSPTASKTESSIESCQDLKSFSLFLSTLVTFCADGIPLFKPPGATKYGHLHIIIHKLYVVPSDSQIC